MAHFIGTLKGSKSEVSRLGTKSSGIEATLNGWDIGVKVKIEHKNNNDVIYVSKTTGSNGDTFNTSFIALDDLLKTYKKTKQ